MAFTPKKLADGVTVAGAATITPSDEKWHITFFTLGDVAGSVFKVTVNGREVARVLGTQEAYSLTDRGIDVSGADQQGTLRNIIVDDGEDIVISRVSGADEAQYYISGYAIT